MLTVGENTNLYKFIRYIEPAVKAGNRTYWVWKKEPVPDRLGHGPRTHRFQTSRTSSSSSAPPGVPP